MPPQEAIKNIDDILDSPYLCDESIDYQLTTYDIECLEKAKEALEKQIPKKPKILKVHDISEYKYGDCECGEHIIDDEKYCSKCGQALDWSDTE